MSASTSSPTTSEARGPAKLTRDDWIKVSLVAFPKDRLGELWAWLQQFPQANFDDGAPEDFEGFARAFDIMATPPRQLWGVEIDGQLLGAIGFEQLSRRTGMLRGICFDRSAHGSGAPLQAVGHFLELAWKTGFRKISARYLASNRRGRAFFKKLGAVDEGYLKDDTEQKGRPIDVRVIAFFAPKEVH